MPMIIGVAALSAVSLAWRSVPLSNALVRTSGAARVAITSGAARVAIPQPQLQRVRMSTPPPDDMTSTPNIDTNRATLDTTIDTNTPPIAVGPRAVSRFFTLRVVTLIATTLALFTAAFVRLERWHVIDALYFSCSTASTIGFGDLRPSGGAGRVLTCLLGCCGVGLLGGLLSALLEQKLFEEQPQPATTPLGRWYARLGLWPKAGAQFLLLMLVGVLGLRACEPPNARPALLTAAYLISGTLTTAGLGDVVPASRAAKAFVSIYSIVGTGARPQPRERH